MGATGRVGKHVVHGLLERGYSVVCLSRDTGECNPPLPKGPMGGTTDRSECDARVCLLGVCELCVYARCVCRVKEGCVRVVQTATRRGGSSATSVRRW